MGSARNSRVRGGGAGERARAIVLIIVVVVVVVALAVVACATVTAAYNRCGVIIATTPPGDATVGVLRPNKTPNPSSALKELYAIKNAQPAAKCIEKKFF